MGGNDGESRHLFVKLGEPADDLVRKSPVIIAIAEYERLAGAFFEAALVIDRVAYVEKAPRR